MLRHLLNFKILAALLYDIAVSIFSFIFALCLRFETLSPFSNNISQLPFYMVTIVLSQVIFFNLMGLYRGMWRFSSSTDLVRILKASLYGTAIPVILLFIWNRLEGFPRSVLLIDLLLVISSLGGGRFLYRIWKDARKQSKVRRQFENDITENVLIVGAGSAGNQILKEISTNDQLNLNVVGFVDDNKTKHGRTIQGVKVWAGTDELNTLVKKHDVSKVFIAIPSASGEDLKRIINHCKETAVEFKTLPKLNEILSGKVELSLLRNINLEDLLGRDPINLDLDNLEKMVTDKVVMVTGAGGSIGSELCNQLSKLNPRKIILFEICELFLYQLEMKLKRLYPSVEFIPCIGDVRFQDRVESVIKEYRPHVVLHAAAYKHVPMMESNPLEAIYTNILGTKIVAEVASKYNCEKFVMISTDKAVNPTNIMGCSKRVAEMVCQYVSKNSKFTKFITVRFGNVLGSNGSVIPLFKEQIENGGPVTVTHKDITRYFMSIPEACQLVLQAASMGDGGEIFVLDMGTPVKIVDLAKDLISLSGLKPDVDIRIDYTGLRPGEKLYEELFSKEEKLVKTSHKKVQRAKACELPENFECSIGDILCLKNTSPRKDIYKTIQQVVREFSSEEFLKLSN